MSEEVLGEEIEQRVRPRPGLAAGQVARVVLDPLAEPHLLHHLDVVFGAHPEALRLDELALLLEPLDPLAPSRARIATIARPIFSAGVTNCFAG